MPVWSRFKKEIVRQKLEIADINKSSKEFFYKGKDKWS